MHIRRRDMLRGLSLGSGAVLLSPFLHGGFGHLVAKILLIHSNRAYQHDFILRDNFIQNREKTQASIPLSLSLSAPFFRSRTHT